LNPEEVALLEKWVQRNLELRAFILRLLDPEDLGHAVSNEVRQAALEALRTRHEHQNVR
jgi:hypothetical protein